MGRGVGKGKSEPEFDEDDFHRRLVCSRTERAEVAYVDVVYKSEFRSELIRWLHSRNTQLSLGILLMMDVVLLFVAVFIDAHWPPCFSLEANAVCTNGTGIEVPVTCLDIPGAVKSVSAIVYVLSISILSIFELELIVLALTMGPVHFARSLAYWFDFSIVTVSIVLEIMLHETEDGALAGGLIFARIWRLIRISHGLFMSKRRQLIVKALNEEDNNVQSLAEPWESEEEDAAEGQFEFRNIKRDDKSAAIVAASDSASTSGSDV